MSTHHHHICGMIPPHILSRVAVADDESGHDARATIAQTHDLRALRDMTLVHRNAVPSPRVLPSHKRRNVYDAQHRTDLPGKLVMSEHKARRGKDREVLEAYDGSGATYDFFHDVFGRDSIDNRGMRIDSTVHYSRRFDNAMWDGEQMVYGDGDGRIFGRFTAALDVIGHELTHGLTQHTAGLGYSGQTGALNEHISDAFGVMVRQYDRNETAEEADWLIGAGLFTSKVKGKAIRSMAAPGTAYDDPILGRDPQPSTMSGYVETDDDNGGVHINSGIPNHAFYLAALAIGGFTWDVPGWIWYLVLTERLRPDADFPDFARATVDIAGERYGNGGAVQRSVADAWKRVGLTVPLHACTSTHRSHVSPSSRQVAPVMKRRRRSER